jgi:integrase/recombinase XerD
MEKKGKERRKEENDSNRLHRFDVLCAWFREHMHAQQFRPRTIEDYCFELSFFRRWVEENSDIADIDDATPALLHEYAASAYARGLAPCSINHKLAILKSFFDSLYECNKLYIDLGRHISLPRVARRLPKNILSETEMSRIFAYLESTTAHLRVTTRPQAGVLRDHALMEMLYSTGIRKAELIACTLSDVNYADGLVHIHGKGGKERVAPIGETSAAVLLRYICKARPLLAAKGISSVFVTMRGGPMGGMSVLDAVKRVVAAAGIGREVTVHSVRHCSATHMLNHGADIRYVQEFLGHASVSTTQVYTHVSIAKLKQTHARCHPREHDDFGQ